MIAMRYLFLVALAYSVNAGRDSDNALKLLECARKAISQGVPSANIPSHNPLRLNDSFSWTGNYENARITLNLSDVTWDKIASWDVSVEQRSNDSSPVAVIIYHLHWDISEIVANYEINTDVLLIPGPLKGVVSVNLTQSDWEGTVRFTKPGFNRIGHVEDIDLTISSSTSFHFSDIEDSLDQSLSSAFSTIVEDYLQKTAQDNIFGKLLKDRLNTYWLSNQERVDALLEFCRNNAVAH